MPFVNLKHRSVTQDAGFMEVTVIMNKYSCSDHVLSPKIKCVLVEESGAVMERKRSFQSSEWTIWLVSAIHLDLLAMNSHSHS